ncbi:MAG: transposase, partial [Nitrospirae bacterium]|nr:transposase [Nitrospirota bacterium]
VTCRGNDRKAIFQDDADRRRFLQILAQSLTSYTVNLYSYVLMTNHFHVLLETPLGNLSECMRRFNITYTGYFNRRHKRVGHLYQGRYQSLLVDKDAYLSILSRYIHLNPVRVKPLDKAPFKEQVNYLVHYPWSSLPGYLHKSKKVFYVEYSLVLGEYGGDTDRARREYQKALLAEIGQGTGLKEQVVGQSILGSAEFITSVTERFLVAEKDRERSSHNALRRYCMKGDLLKAIERETGKNLETLSIEKGEVRQLAMELLYRRGGLRGPEVGRLFGVDYSSVSQERKRLHEKLRKHRKLQALLDRIEQRCQ